MIFLKVEGFVFKWSNITIKKAIFFYYEKSWNGQRYPFSNMNYFWHLMWKTFCFLDRANSIKTNLQTYNLQIGQYNYKYKSVNQFWWNLPYPNGKKFSRWNVETFSHLQLGIFCHFDVCHSRRNALGFSDIPLSSRWGKSLIWFFLCMVQWPENYLKRRNAPHWEISDKA